VCLLTTARFIQQRDYAEEERKDSLRIETPDLQALLFAGPNMDPHANPGGNFESLNSLIAQWGFSLSNNLDQSITLLSRVTLEPIAVHYSQKARVSDRLQVEADLLVCTRGNYSCSQNLSIDSEIFPLWK